MSKNLQKALREQKQQTEQTALEIFGTLGIPLGGQRIVEVPNRNGFVYVKLRDNQNEVIQAFNNQVTTSYGLPVKVQRQGNRYIVIGVDTQRYQNIWNSNSPFLPKHGTSHSFNLDGGGGGDITWTYSRQFMPLLVYPTSATGAWNVNIGTHPLLSNQGVWKLVGNTGTPSLDPYLPTGSNAVMALLYMDADTGNPGVLIGSGSYFSNTLTGTGDVFPYIPTPNPATQIPIAAVRLDTGTHFLGWENLYDVRQWIQTIPTGTSSGGGGSVGISGTFVQDEGIPKGFVTTLNFVGVNIDASVSGSVARVFVTGSTGGGGSGVDTIGFAGLSNGVPIGTGTVLNIHGADFTRSGTVFDLNITGSGGLVTVPVTGSFVVQNNGVTLGSATVLNFTNGVTASISGSVAQIQITGTSTYVRTAPPVSLSSVTGTYWRTQERVFASGSLALFNQGHALIPAIDYLEQYPVSGTFQYISTPPTGTYNLAIYGVPVAGGSVGGGGAGGGGMLSVTILPANYVGSSGSWSFNGSFLFQNNRANGDYTEYSLYLDAGTYSLYYSYGRGTDRPIADFLIDGVSIGTIDTYGSATNYAVGSIIGFTVATSGVKTLRVAVNGRNASSTDWYLLWRDLRLFRTL